MGISRRRMLEQLLATAAAGAFVPVVRAIPAAASPLATRNFGSTGRAALTEGETLLVELAFPNDVLSVDGSFPVTITPRAVAGQTLVEPQPLHFYPGDDQATWRTILSAPLDSGGQRATLRVGALAEAGRREQQYEQEYESLPGTYGRSILRLSPETTAPSPEVAERKRHDFETNAALFKRRTPRVWSEEFTPAVGVASKNNFGLRRTVNGTLHYRHGGLDYPVAAGTPVRAINAGRVAYSGEQWTPGRVVILDHGGGIFSRYMHLSQRYAAVGDLVERGQVLGLSGNTGGQKPAPHLHLDTFVNGTAVNPQSLKQTAARLLALERSSRGR